MKLVILFAAALALSACAGVKPASIGGECQLFPDPGFAVQGKRAKDRKWIGQVQETGIAICDWKRPKQ